MIVAPNEGLPDLLSYVLQWPLVGVLPWTLILWTNDDLEPDQDTVYADLIEATFDGYSPVTLDRAEWTDPVIDDDHAVSTYGTDPIMWMSDGSEETVYGYAIVTSYNPLIRFIELLPSPVAVEPAGTIGVLPQITLTTEQLVMGTRVPRRRDRRRNSK